MKFKATFILIFTFFVCTSSLAQHQTKKQHRIKKAQFPTAAIKTLTENSSAIKRLKFYQEINTTEKVFTAKFKKSRLYYEFDFDDSGNFKSASFVINQIDIPEDSFQQMSKYLAENFKKVKVRKMLQVYPNNLEDGVAKIIKNTFQNLMIPNLNYKFLIRATTTKKQAIYEVFFDTHGNFLKQKQAFTAN